MEKDNKVEEFADLRKPNESKVERDWILDCTIIRTMEDLEWIPNTCRILDGIEGSLLR